MSERKHTPGPWAIQDNAEFGVHVYSGGGIGRGGKHLARVSTAGGVDVLANAHLIAAAPDMLAQLTGWATLMDPANPEFDPTFSPSLAAVRAAIAKATGQ